MKMICIDNKGVDALMLDVVYDVTINAACVIDSINGIYCKSRFMSIEDYRDKQLKEVLGEV